MIRRIQQHEILKAIVSLVPVDVMHVLVSFEWATQRFRHYLAVLEHIDLGASPLLRRNPNMDVSVANPLAPFPPIMLRASPCPKRTPYSMPLAPLRHRGLGYPKLRCDFSVGQSLLNQTGDLASDLASYEHVHGQ